MISNERPSPFGNRSYGNYQKPQVVEDTIKSEKIQIERKTFLLALKENPRGRFLRITEDVGGRRDTIIIPAPGLEEFVNIINEMVRVSAETPEKGNAAPANNRKGRHRDPNREPAQPREDIDRGDIHNE